VSEEPIIALTEPDWIVRRTAFRALMETGEPWDADRVAIPGVDPRSVRTAVRRLVEAGRARTDDRGRVTAACGISLTETQHRIETRHGSRWTNCAYDALGILGALEADGGVVSRSPSTGREIGVRFERGRPVGSDGVLFLADQSCCSRPNEDWCPNVNLFEDGSLALRWAEEHGVGGRVVSLEEGADLGAMEWRRLVEGHPWAETRPSPTSERAGGA
jgi:hypothetical protein